VRSRVVDREQMPDVWKLIDYLGESLDEHTAALGTESD
jgi:hypothetical protein